MSSAVPRRFRGGVPLAAEAASSVSHFLSRQLSELEAGSKRPSWSTMATAIATAIVDQEVNPTFPETEGERAGERHGTGTERQSSSAGASAVDTSYKTTPERHIAGVLKLRVPLPRSTPTDKQTG